MASSVLCMRFVASSAQVERSSCERLCLVLGCGCAAGVSTSAMGRFRAGDDASRRWRGACAGCAGVLDGDGSWWWTGGERDLVRRVVLRSAAGRIRLAIVLMALSMLAQNHPPSHEQVRAAIGGARGLVKALALGVRASSRGELKHCGG